MDKNQIELYQKKLHRYHFHSWGKKKIEMRNQIFVDLQPFMMKWISAILSKKGIFLSQEEILSKSWDCFEFCLKHYKPNKKIPVPNHFYSYTNFYLMKRPFVLADAKLIDFEPEYENLLGTDSENKMNEHLEELKSFRSCLDPEYAMVFDDAIMSLCSWNNDRQCRIKELNLTRVRYKESKKIFKIVIDYLLRR